MTDDQLKLALAKMLPEKISGNAELNEWELCTDNAWLPIRDTEWLHVCFLVEETLTQYDRGRFSHFLSVLQEETQAHYDCLFDPLHASWQQRATALCKVKGIEP